MYCCDPNLVFGPPVYEFRKICQFCLHILVFVAKYKKIIVNKINQMNNSQFFFSLQLAGSGGKEFHFKHKVLHHARTRRSITHTRILKREPLVS